MTPKIELEKKPQTTLAAFIRTATNQQAGVKANPPAKCLARFFDPQITPAWASNKLAREDATGAGDICLGAVELAVATQLAIFVLRELGFVNVRIGCAKATLALANVATLTAETIMN